jgi:hypothetical protein
MGLKQPAKENGGRLGGLGARRGDAHPLARGDRSSERHAETLELYRLGAERRR